MLPQTTSTVLVARLWSLFQVKIKCNQNMMIFFRVFFMYVVTVDIDGVSQMNYALIQAPTFTSSYVQADIKVLHML